VNFEILQELRLHCQFCRGSYKDITAKDLNFNRPNP